MIHLKEPPGVLGKIVARTLSDLQKRQGELPDRDEPIRDFALALDRSVITNHVRLPDGRVLRGFSNPRARAARAERSGRGTVAPGLGHSLIAEFKPRSPSRGDIRPGAVVEDIAGLYAPYASAMSVLTDAPWFGGDGSLLMRARAAIPVPILRKDFIVSRFQVEESFALGADALLLMASLLTPASLAALLAQTRDLGMEALVEVHDERELDEALEAGARVVGINSRDLTTLEIDLARAHELLGLVPQDRVVVAESGLRTRADIEALPANVDAVLIGTAFMAADDPVAAIQAMGFAPCR